MKFSERYGYTEKPVIQFERMTSELRTRLWNKFKHYEYTDNPFYGTQTNVEIIMDRLGMTYETSIMNCRASNLSKLGDYVLYKIHWYEVYNFLELHVSLYDGEDKQMFCTDYNKILEEENAGYRFIDGYITPITNEQEIQSIGKASNTEYEAVNTHIEKAISLLSYKNHDYENVIKESVSAVESLCKIITEGNQTIGQALKQLENKGIQIPQSLLKSMSGLFGYASAEVRHGNSEASEVSLEDAKFILVWCSAFINYLIEKWEKAQ